MVAQTLLLLLLSATGCFCQDGGRKLSLRESGLSHLVMAAAHSLEVVAVPQETWGAPVYFRELSLGEF